MQSFSYFSKNTFKVISLGLFSLVVGLLASCGADDTEEADSVEGVDTVEAPELDASEPESLTDTPDTNTHEADTTDVLAAAALPEVNTTLATATPAGIWMILVDEASTLPNSEDSMNPFIFEKHSRELVVIADNGDGIYTMSRCDTTWRDDYTLTATETGYSAALSEASAVDDSGVTYTTVTNFEVVYDSDNQTLTATGSMLTTPVGEDLTLAVNGVKISDSTDFSTAPDFTALATLEYINLGNGDADPAGSAQTINDLAIECLGISNGTKTTESTEDEWLLEQAYYTAFIDNGNADTTDQIQYYRLDQNTNGDETRSLGAVIDVDGVFTMYVHACSTENTECLAAAEWTETVTSSATGLAFDVDFQVVENTYVVNPLAVTPWTAFLWPHDGDYMHAVVSMEEN
jgi:hypothetical protein